MISQQKDKKETLSAVHLFPAKIIKLINILHFLSKFIVEYCKRLGTRSPSCPQTFPPISLERGQRYSNLKKKVKKCPANYRPKSLKSVTGKFRVRTITDEITVFFGTNMLRGVSRHGFRRSFLSNKSAKNVLAKNGNF